MVQNTEKWGKSAAKSRYGSTPTFKQPADQSQPQFPEDAHGAQYANDASGWVRGANGRAEAKPGFDKTKLKRA